MVRKKWGNNTLTKGFIILLCSILCVRGGVYINILRTDDAIEKMSKIMDQIPEVDIDHITELKPGSMAFMDVYLPMPVIAENLIDERYSNPDTCELTSGEVIITTSQEYTCSPYYLPILSKTANEYIRRWKLFQDVNAEYQIGRLYPQSYSYLFGYWIKGTTGILEFPPNLFYYRNNS